MKKQKNKIIRVHDRMQKSYSYELEEPVGKNYPPCFQPQLTPPEMLRLGVFGGKYMTDCEKEFPRSWFRGAKLCPERHDPALNYFKVNASQPLSVWRKNGWIDRRDPRGWFQWYCRYYRGRRIAKEDERQINRWLAIKRHLSQIKKHCVPGDMNCRPRQRQALLHWAYDTRKI